MSRNNTEYTAILPAGEYYIGDLCYVMHDEWEEVINLMFPGEDDSLMVEGLLELADGRKFFYGSTAYGDGTYNDNRSGYYPVDAGLIGIIATKDVLEADKANLTDGVVYTFDEAFTVTACGGVYDFGGVKIDTAMFDDEEDDWDYEDEYEDENY